MTTLVALLKLGSVLIGAVFLVLTGDSEFKRRLTKAAHETLKANSHTKSGIDFCINLLRYLALSIIFYNTMTFLLESIREPDSQI